MMTHDDSEPTSDGPSMNSTTRFFDDHYRFVLKLIVCLSLSLYNAVESRQTVAQPLGDLPRPTYYVARELFRMGDNQGAAAGFERVISVSRQLIPDGWIDLIPPHVMLGECLYQQGNLSAALEQYHIALDIALRYPAWLNQFNLGDSTVAVTDISAKGINWFRLSFPSSSLAVPDSVQLQIDISQTKTDSQGNITAPVNLVTRLDSSEVLRALGIALVRRWQILGPLAQNSAISDQLVQYFSLNLQQPHPWANMSWGTLRGLALLTRDEQQARQQLRSTYQIRGNFDYFLSPLSLMVQGKIAANRGEYQAAISHLQDATLLAAQYDQFDTLSESMFWLSDCACADERFDLLDGIRSAASWTSKRTPLGFVACLSGAAELSIQSGNIAEAKRVAGRLSAILRPRDISLPRFQARLAFIETLIAIEERQGSLAANRLTVALNLMRGSASLGAIPERIFQKQRTLDLLASGQITSVEADRLLTILLAEPPTNEWEIQPLETLAALTTSSLAAYLRWLRLSELGDPKIIAQRMDRIQQQQLFEALPLAGRTQAWQHAVTTPMGQLPADVRGVVQAAVQKNPQLLQLPQQIELAKQQLKNNPPPLDDRQLRPEIRQGFTRLEVLGESMDRLLLRQSVSRKSIRRLFPSAWSLEETLALLSDEDTLIAFVVAGDEIFGFATDGNKLETWKITDIPLLLSQLDVFFRQIGLIRSGPGKKSDPIIGAQAAWRQTAQEIFLSLFPADCRTLIEKANRLIINPHGFLWYVPFEALITVNDTPLISKYSIVYLPTMGSLPLIFRSVAPPTNSLAVISPVFSLDRSVNTREAQKAFEPGVTSAIFLEQRIGAPSSLWLRVHADEITTAHPTVTGSDSWAVRPIPIDGKPGGTLAEWVGSSLPVPPWIFLPMNDSSVRTGQLQSGNDLFLPACGIAYGGNLGMISRWAVGGVSSSRYLQRVRQELRDNQRLSSSTRRAALAIWSEQFNAEEEPILKPLSSDGARVTSGEHPLLWSSYMTIGDYEPIK
jgi:tetratricopeptide (TPR) repeat protein